MTVLVVLLAWLALTGIGWMVLAPLQRARRDLLLPGAPLFGIILLVVVLHDTTLIVSVRTGVWFVAGVLVILGVVATRRDPSWWRPSRKALATLALTAACGVVPAVWALGPSLAVGDSAVIQPSDNNDAFYYVSVIDWLEDHPATQVPLISPDPEGPGVPPSYAPARAQLTLNLRIGQELTQAALTTVLGSDADRTWYPLTALWLLLMPASGVAAARFLRLQLVTGLAIGLMTSVSSLVIFQLAAQNSDSLLGSALTPLTIGAVLSALGRHRLAPLPLAALALTGLVGTYTEMVPLLAPALGLAVLVRPRREVLQSLRTAVVMLVLAVVAAPLVWIRAVRSLLFLGGIPSDNFPSTFEGASWPVLLGRFLGLTGPAATHVSLPLLALVVALALVGVGCAVVLSRRRWCYAALVVVGTSLSIYLVTVRHRPYTQQRVVQLLLPLVVLVAAAGWDHLWRSVRARRRTTGARRRRPPRGRERGIALVGLAGVVVFLVSNSLVDHDMDLPAQARARHVGPDFAEAAGWVRAVGGPGGSGASVLVGDFFSQLWITDALRDEPDVAYPSLYVSYQAQAAYWNGQPRRWLLVDRNAIRDVGPNVVVHRNDRFALLDLSRGQAVVAVPADVFGQNSYIVLRSSRGPDHIDLLGSTRARAPTDVAASPGFGDPPPAHYLRAGTSSIPIDLTGSVAQRIVLSDARDVFSLQGIQPS